MIMTYIYIFFVLYNICIPFVLQIICSLYIIIVSLSTSPDWPILPNLQVDGWMKPNVWKSQVRIFGGQKKNHNGS